MQFENFKAKYFNLARFPRPGMDSRTYDVKKDVIRRDQLLALHSRQNTEDHDADYESSDDESCDLESGDFDTMSSCRSKARSCCSVTTVANDDFEFFQRKGTKVTFIFIIFSIYFNKRLFLRLTKLVFF